MPKSGKIASPKQVSAKTLHKVASGKGAVRSGSTVDVQRRAGEYQAEGYSGTMYYAKTQNMKTAEDRLLQAGPGIHNAMKKSGAQKKGGFVYAIKGKKYHKK